MVKEVGIAPNKKTAPQNEEFDEYEILESKVGGEYAKME